LRSTTWTEDGWRHRGWLALCRLSAGVLLAGLALFGEGTFQSPAGLWVAAAAATVVALTTTVWTGGRVLGSFLLLSDLTWISLAVVAAGRADAGITLLYTLVAFAAGLTVGGGGALLISSVTAVTLVAAGSSLGMLLDQPTSIVAQAALVLVLGGVADRIRELIDARDRALEYASQVLERMRLDTDTIVRNLGSGLISVDITGRVVHLNAMAATTLGIEDEPAQGRHMNEILGTEGRALVEEIERALVQGTPVQRKQLHVRRGELSIPLGLGTTILRGPEGETRGVAVLFQDLTDVKREEAARRRKDRLAAVGELAAGIAHEIRNSILPVSGSVQILSQELNANDEQSKLFDMILRETENIERFVSSLLNYTGSRTLQVRDVAVQDLLETVCGELAVSRPEGPTITREGEPVTVRGDNAQLAQVIRNLVGNAADAAGPEGRVTVTSGADDRGAWIDVEDTGPGIGDDGRDQVFQPFFTTKAGGTGLGLPIAARITSDHGGELILATTGETGTRFRVSLPADGITEVESALAA